MNHSHAQGYRKSELGMPWQHGAKPRKSDARLPFPVPSGEGLGQIVYRELGEVLAGCGTFEWVALGYLAISGALILIFSGNLAHPLRLLSVQALVGCGIVALCRAEANVWTGTAESPLEEFGARGIGRDTLTQRFWHFCRHWYPHLFFLFCFEELGALVHMVSRRWQDAKLVAFDHWLTGVHPSIWLEQFTTVGRNEFMQGAYLTYFVYLLVLGGILYYSEDWHGYWSVMTYSAVAYAMGYVIAIFFPIESPWFAMAGAWHGELHGGPFTAVINFIEHYGRVRGAAFPSEHVAGSFAALWGAWRHRRWLFWVMLPLVMCMCVSTVWGRYHYVVDVFGGMVTGTLGYVIGKWLMKRREEVDSRQFKVERAEFRSVRQ
jgi:membrane-associated phospholipid phosphatase